MVGQSIICATVTVSFVFSPPCSWDALLGEGLASLNGLSLPLNHWNGHLNVNSPFGSSIVTIEFLLVCALPCGLWKCDKDQCKLFLVGVYADQEHDLL